MLLQSTLLAIWAGFCIVDERTFWFGTPKALIAGTVAGIIMGDVTTGLVISGTLQLMWLANVSIGAYIPPNEAIGSIIGVAIAIMTNGGIATGLAIAIPTALLSQQIIMLTNTLNIVWIHRADAAADSGDFDKVARYNYYGLPFSFLAGAIPVFIAVYFGGQAVESLLNLVPEQIFDGLNVAAGIIPVVGMGMLLMMMMKKNMWIFLLIGFVLATYLNLGTIAISILGICLAFLYDMIINKPDDNNGGSAVKTASDNSLQEEEYDL